MYLTTQKIPLVTGNRFLFVMLLCGAAGNIVGGFISDKIGRKKVIIASLVGTTLFLFLFLQTSGALQWIFMALAGTCLLASYSVTVVLTQELLHENAAMASGLILGFAMGVGGLGV